MFKINSFADLSRAIVLAEADDAPGLGHLLRAVGAGKITLLTVNTETSATMFKQWTRMTSGMPAIALVQDDDYVDRGPAGIAVGERAVRWARSVLLHASGAQITHYQACIEAAQVVRRMLLIEASTATAPQWLDLIARQPKPPTLTVIWPQEGLHPILPPRGRMQ